MDGLSSPNLRRPRRLEGARSLAEIRREGFVPFLLGPVYVYAGVTECLVEAFLADDTVKGRPAEASGMVLRFSEPVCARCEGHNVLMTLLDKATYPHFKKWLISQRFVDRAARKFCVPRAYSCAFADPIRREVDRVRLPETVEVYTLSGVRCLLAPKQARGLAATTDVDPEGLSPRDEVPKRMLERFPEYVDFERLPPEEEVIVEARAVLEIVDGL